VDSINIILQEYEKYRESMLKFQEQHKLIFNTESKACSTILSNVKHFTDCLISKINEEYDKERRNQQTNTELRSKSTS
jgi:hypothetical protein